MKVKTETHATTVAIVSVNGQDVVGFDAAWQLAKTLPLPVRMSFVRFGHR